MKKWLCCLKGESSGQEAAELPDNPFGNNEFLNYANRNGLELPDDPNSPGAHRLPPHPLELCGNTFQWPEIFQGTGNLRRFNLLGTGRSGDVYRCVLPNAVGAAKIQKEGNADAHAEFVAELTTLHRAHHPNVIKLLGKCFGRPKPAIVYEFMPYGSLDKHLFGKTMRSKQGARGLDWDRRMVIAVGVAKALVYLHNGLKKVHRDVKASNVLLDENFMPKLTGFESVSDIVENEAGYEIESVVSPIKGTKGYMPLETEGSEKVSTKSDVYSYGILLFELFTGRKALDEERPLGRRKINDWLSPIWSRNNYMPLVVDVSLGHRYNDEGLTGVFEVARMCTLPEAIARPNMNFVEQMILDAAIFPAPGAHGLPPYPLQLCGVTFQWPEILHGTGYLLRANLLGTGRSGNVFRCVLPNDDAVGAAKIQKESNADAHAEFVAEVTTLHRAHHPNVIKLLGKCFGRPKLAIVYEFMPNGSLDKHLFGKTMRSKQGARGLDWDRRMVIAVGVAKALKYLHYELKKVHRDVKASNVLLDENFMPKLTGFGSVSDIVDDEAGYEIESVVSPIKGTKGYMPLETEGSEKVSTKSDVYSYGILLFELFTGRKALDEERPLGRSKINNWLSPVWTRYNYMPLVVDPVLGLRYNVQGLVGVFQLARMCTQSQAIARPNMNVVEQMILDAAVFPAAECPSLTRRLSV